MTARTSRGRFALQCSRLRNATTQQTRKSDNYPSLRPSRERYGHTTKRVGLKSKISWKIHRDRTELPASRCRRKISSSTASAIVIAYTVLVTVDRILTIWRRRSSAPPAAEAACARFPVDRYTLATL